MDSRSVIQSHLSGIMHLCILLAVLSAKPCQGGDRWGYHAVRRSIQGQPAGLLEAELLRSKGNTRPQDMAHFGAGWHGDSHLLWNGLVGEESSLEFEVSESGEYTLEMQWTVAPDYGVFEVKLDQQVIEPALDLYATKVGLAPLRFLGLFQLEAGIHHLHIRLTGGHPDAHKYGGNGYLYGLDYLNLKTSAPVVSQEKVRSKKKFDEVSFAEAKALMKEHCFKCHGDARTKGELNFEAMESPEAFLESIEQVRLAAEAVSMAEMPPEDELQPGAEEREKLVSFFDALVETHVSTHSILEPLVIRRLNRYEYNNAVRDLLQLRGDIYPLPEKIIKGSQYFDPATGKMPDAIKVGNRTLGKFQLERQILEGVDPFAIDLQAEHGFNNRGEELSVSPLLLESLLSLGRSIVHAPEFDAYTGLADTFFKEQESSVGDVLRPFLERAFRGPVEDAALQRYVAFHHAEETRTGSYGLAMKSVVAAILASPKFLYVFEGKSDQEGKLLLDDYELAQRLSFFLWSSIPDDSLIEAARRGELTQVEVLESQVRRMLDDPRSRALSENFARQWLRLDQLITAVPDFDRFQVYYSRIGCEQWKFGLQTMVEPLLLFESIQIEDRSIMLLVDSDYAYRSDELQAWYERPDAPFGEKQNRNRFDTFTQVFRKRKLATRREGGVITSAAVLTMTSTPLRTSPIKRGAWVAGVIFNDPPPPPPDIIPEIEADDALMEAKGLTIRQRLKQHASDQDCASCHARIDPMGFALEGFDPVGRWRERYNSGLPIDASGRLFGKEVFTDIEGFKDAILDHPEIFMRAFSEHLLSYALGRALTLNDKPAVDLITQRVLVERGRFSTVVTEIVKSLPFRHKTRQQQTQ